MAEGSNLPGLPSTVDMGGAGSPIQGDPLEFMQTKAREAIESINNNPIIDGPNKLKFKKKVLKDLKTAIDRMNEIDKKYEAQKVEEEETAGTEGGAPEEEDPFADIFGEETEEPDEATKEKNEIAREFEYNLKMYKENFIREIRIKKEQMQKQKDQKKLQNLLGKLNNI